MLEDADLLIGLSGARVVPASALARMNPDPIVFALANPDPEVAPEEALRYARILATGRSDYPNQINNVLCFPGVFRGALDVRAPAITESMKTAAARAIAEIVGDHELREDYVIPSVFNREVAPAVAAAVAAEARASGTAEAGAELGFGSTEEFGAGVPGGSRAAAVGRPRQGPTRPTRGHNPPASCRPGRSQHFRPVRPGRDHTLGKEARRDRAARRAPLRVLGIAVATAATTVLAGAGEAFWVCVPAALLAAATSRGPRGGAIGAGVVVAAAGGAALARASVHPLPSTALIVLVPAASVAILVSLRKRLEDERNALRASAFSDPLTGVANRRSLLERIDYEIARHARNRRSFTLLMLDLDGFKALNDRFGHPAGDDLLCDVAAALSRVIRDQDTLARVGGDEFCVLAPETDSAGAERLTSRVKPAVARAVAGVDALGASVGAAVFPDDGKSADALLEAADQRLLGAKRHSHGGRHRRRAA